jgi:hypothetical protein
MTITHQEEKRINKIMRSIKIHHKLYFRTAKGEVRRLDKTADSKHWSDLKPINLAIPIEYEAEFKKLQKAIGSNVDNVMVTYNGSWKLLVNIFVAPQQK